MDLLLQLRADVNIDWENQKLIIHDKVYESQRLLQYHARKKEVSQYLIYIFRRLTFSEAKRLIWIDRANN